MALPSGTYKARAKAWGFGLAKTGTEQIGVSFEVAEGPCMGQRAPWYGFFNSEENAKRAMSAMRRCGWDGTGPVTEAQGLDKNDVEIVVEEEEYGGEKRTKVAWVNAIGVALNPMPDSYKAEFNKRMAKYQTASNGTTSATRASTPRRTASSPVSRAEGGEDAPFADDDIPF